MRRKINTFKIVVSILLVVITTLILTVEAKAQFGQRFKIIQLDNGDSLLFNQNDGSIYYNETSNEFRFRENGVWRGLGALGSSGDFWKTSGNTDLDGNQINVTNDGLYKTLFRFNDVNYSPATGSFLRLQKTDESLSFTQFKLRNYSIETDGGILPGGLAATVHTLSADSLTSPLLAVHQNGNAYLGKGNATNPNTHFGALMYINDYSANWQDGDNNGTITRSRVIPDIGFIEDSLSNYWPLSGDFSNTGNQTVTLGGELIFSTTTGTRGPRLKITDNFTSLAGDNSVNPYYALALADDMDNAADNRIAWAHNGTDSLLTTWKATGSNFFHTMVARDDRISFHVIEEDASPGSYPPSNPYNFQNLRFADPVNDQDGATKNYVDSYFTGSITDASATEAEINAACSCTPAGVGAGRTLTIKDTDGTANIYMSTSDGSGWYVEEKGGPVP